MTNHVSYTNPCLGCSPVPAPAPVLALTAPGHSANEARTAVATAVAHVGRNVEFAPLIRKALRRCASPNGYASAPTVARGDEP